MPSLFIGLNRLRVRFQERPFPKSIPLFLRISSSSSLSIRNAAFLFMFNEIGSKAQYPFNTGQDMAKSRSCLISLKPIQAPSFCSLLLILMNDPGKFGSPGDSIVMVPRARARAAPFLALFGGGEVLAKRVIEDNLEKYFLKGMVLLPGPVSSLDLPSLDLPLPSNLWHLVGRHISVFYVFSALDHPTSQQPDLDFVSYGAVDKATQVDGQLR